MDKEMLKGHLDGLILSVLDSGAQHGYGIVEELRRRSGGALDLPSGTVYPALHRLERSSLIAGDWSVHDGRRRRSYRLTAAGRLALTRRRSGWVRFRGMIDTMLGEAT